MANYVAHYRKELQRLARKKLDLARLIDRGGTEEQIAQAAEEVRVSKLRAIEAQRAQIAPCEANADKLRRLQEEIKVWQNLPIAAVVALCKVRSRDPECSEQPRCDRVP